jgi:hypothetical protein
MAILSWDGKFSRQSGIGNISDHSITYWINVYPIQEYASVIFSVLMSHFAKLRVVLGNHSD